MLSRSKVPLSEIWCTHLPKQTSCAPGIVCLGVEEEFHTHLLYREVSIRSFAASLEKVKEKMCLLQCCSNSSGPSYHQNRKKILIFCMSHYNEQQQAGAGQAVFSTVSVSIQGAYFFLFRMGFIVLGSLSSHLLFLTSAPLAWTPEY